MATLRPIQTFQTNDRITGVSFTAEDIVLDLGLLPVPGLFFNSESEARDVKAQVRLVRSSASGLYQLDSDLNPQYYRFYKSGKANTAHFEYLERFAESLLKYVPLNSKILDIGGGKGHLIRALAAKGFHNLHLIDPSAEALLSNYCSVINDVFPGALKDEHACYDVIINQHFLEHSTAPLRALEEMAKVLKPRGYVFIEVPDIEDSALANKGSHLSIIYALHSSYFDRQTLSFIAEKAGLVTESIVTADHYGKSLVGIFRKADSTETVSRENVQVNYLTIEASIVAYFDELQTFGSKLSKGIPCWGAAERCLTVLGGLIAGGFEPGQLIDSNPDLIGKFIACSSSPIISPSQCLKPIEELVILSITNAKAIVRDNPNLFTSESVIHIPRTGTFKVTKFMA